MGTGYTRCKEQFYSSFGRIFDVEISDLFNNETNINIKQSFKDSSINTAILILTDKEAIGRVLDAVRQKE